jgi:hypothetical protein
MSWASPMARLSSHWSNNKESPPKGGLFLLTEGPHPSML